MIKATTTADEKHQEISAPTKSKFRTAIISFPFESRIENYCMHNNRICTSQRQKPSTMNKQINKGSKLVLVFVLVSLLSPSNGFMQSPAFLGSRGVSRSSPGKKSEGEVGRPFTVLDAGPPELSSVIANPSVEAESLTVLAHVALDFSGFVMSPSRSLLRLFTVIGRVFAISADYVADQTIHTEELIIQLFLISVAIKELLSEKNFAPPVSEVTRSSVPTNSTQ
jgi:hypothetical protein